MIRLLPDVNILVYAHRNDMPQHEVARDWLEHAKVQKCEILLLSQTLLGYLRVVTNPIIFQEPATFGNALAEMRALLASPAVSLISFSPENLNTFQRLARDNKLAGGGIMDAYMAAVAIDHQATLVSCDKGFARFKGLHWINPVEERQS